jgi:hypothetical protein
MRRATAWIVVVGVLACAGSPTPARADDGFWVSVAAGVAGSAAPADYSEFWFDSPHGPAIAVNQITGGGSIQATTAGGTTIFNGLGTPVLLPTTDGHATVSSGGDYGSGGLPRFAGGTQASGAPQTAVPTGDANLVSLDFGPKADDGSQVLSVGVTDPNGGTIGGTTVTLPDGGWWVIGLGPGSNGQTTPPDPDPDPDPVPDPDGGGGVIPDPPPTSGGGGTVATPEPATVVLLGLGGLTAAGWRRLRRK